MSIGKFSLLPHKPDWRYRAAISGKTTIENCTDSLIIRYLEAKAKGFRTDPELFLLIDMCPEDRGLIEAMYLGGAPIHQVSKYTKTVPSTVQLCIDFFFDVDAVKDSPILRTQIANRELNRTVRSYKTFSAKYGWKKFVDQFKSQEEILKETPPKVPEAQTDLLLELKNKITELGVFETGSPESKELLAWMKLFLDLVREMRTHDWETEKEKDTDIGRLMGYLRDNEHMNFRKKDFGLIIKGTSGEIADEMPTTEDEN